MDHLQATQSMAVEKYLLDELTPEMRDRFEEHYFDCQECATDLRATSAFIDATRREFSANPVGKPQTPPGSKRPFVVLRPLLAWSALAASLLVIGYQNVVQYPRYRTQIAELRAPEILPALSLVGGNSRGGEHPAMTVSPRKPFLLSLDLPTQDLYSSYTCLLYSPSGSLVWRLEVSAEMAKDTLSIRVPGIDTQPGAYSLLVQGKGPGPSARPVDLGRYPFTLKPY